MLGAGLRRDEREQKTQEPWHFRAGGGSGGGCQGDLASEGRRGSSVELEAWL